MDEKNHKLCVAMPVPLEENTQTFSQAYQDSVKDHVAKPGPGSALDTYLPAEPASNPSLDTETASVSHLQSGVGLTCEADLTLDDTQRGKARAALQTTINYATLADRLFLRPRN